MNLHDTMPGYRGQIQVRYLPSNKPVADTHNIITYSGADLMARLLAGDQSALPQHIGFLYGTAASPAISDPVRTQDWMDVATEVSGLAGNILVAPLALQPSVALAGDSNLYVANSAMFTSHTGLVLEYAFSGGDYAETLAALEASSTPVYFYHVFLLNRRANPDGSVTYIPFARAILGEAPFAAKPAMEHMAVYWQIIFN